MKPLFKSIACILGLAAISSAPLRAQNAPTRDIVDTAIAAGSFNTLAAALTAADLVDTLKEQGRFTVEGPFTVFAPTDEAFSRYGERSVNDLLMPDNKELLIEILSNHVVAGEIPSSKAVEAGKQSFNHEGREEHEGSGADHRSPLLNGAGCAQRIVLENPAHFCLLSFM